MITINDVHKAYEVLEPIVQETPCILADAISMNTNSQVYLKLENLQITGSFKPRGAYYALSQLTTAERKKGVIAASAGNHSQGVAYGAKRLKIRSTIVMPTTTPLIKIQNTQSLGAKVVLHGETFDDAFAHAKKLAKQKGLRLIHAFDDEHVMAGQGTIALEFFKQIGHCDIVVVPIGGGGMISGIATAIKSLSPKTKVIGVQAAGASAAYETWKHKRKKTIHPDTIADGIAIKRPGRKTLAHMRKHVDDIVLVSEEDITGAIVHLLETRKMVAEPAGVVSLAAIRAGRVKVKNKTVVCIISGGNMDIRLLDSIIRQGMVSQGRLYEFKTHIEDKPKAMESLTRAIASTDTNILAIYHERLNPSSNVKKVQVDIILETMNHAHQKQVKKELKKRGYTIEH